ncbi:hypothetical protein M885DRAFT_522557 [Pelagophyceae sp. CCMP2097]|nr:hypothetical protein M885DRAFT_522557 [Pelagophyceae sp. CCMP2097]
MGIIGGPRRGSGAVGEVRPRKRLDERRVAKLVALRRAALTQTFHEGAPRPKLQAVDAIVMAKSLPALPGPPSPDKPLPIKSRGGSRGNSRGGSRGSQLPVDWRTLAACEVVLDLEDEQRRKDAAKVKFTKMRTDLENQLAANEVRRSAEKLAQRQWVLEAARATEKARLMDLDDLTKKRAKRLLNIELFAEQARLGAARRAAEKFREAFEEKALVDAAKLSLEDERQKDFAEVGKRKEAQERLTREIAVERTLKAARIAAEHLENDRILHEANLKSEELQKRRDDAVQKREATMKKYELMHAQGAGKKAVEDEKATLALTERYQQEKLVGDDAREAKKQASRAASLAAILKENDFQKATRKAEKLAKQRATALDKEKALKDYGDATLLEESKAAKKLRQRRDLQDLLEEQVRLVAVRKAHERVQMSATEVALNREFVANVLADPKRKTDLKFLLA